MQTIYAPNSLSLSPPNKKEHPITLYTDQDDHQSSRIQVPYSAYSLRTGFIAYAHKRGVRPPKTHTTATTSPSQQSAYTRFVDVWEDNAVTALAF